MSTPRTPRLNADWHLAHRMPKNPTREQRIAWHREHNQHCQCAPVPPSLVAAVRGTDEAPTKRKTRPRKSKTRA
jgi:hypothetical protein